MATDWERIAYEKRESIRALLPKDWTAGEPAPSTSKLPNATEYPRSFLTQREIDITEKYTAQELVSKLADRTYTSVEVTSAFCPRATIAHGLVSLSKMY